MERCTLRLQQASFSYLRGGHGPRTLICLHGYGESAESFAFLEPLLGQRYTLYALDLPWHGQTRWERGLTFPVGGLADLLRQLVPGFDTGRHTLLAYSMGGRVALSLLDRLPHRFEQTVLLAPDGLRVNPWYWLATQTQPGNRLFRFTMRHPQWFRGLVDKVGRRGWVNPGVRKFAHRYIDDPQVREDLYRIWTTHRKFRPRMERISELVPAHRIRIDLVFGRYDRIIHTRNAHRLLSRLPPGQPWVQVHELEAGHHLLQPKHAARWVSLLLQE
ncbi:MAG TPA: alpha/beta hydrolase [Lacibacter sp.]|nr:alpha/beta hydrolase [Lacibacter sp.]